MGGPDLAFPSLRMAKVLSRELIMLPSRPRSPVKFKPRPHQPPVASTDALNPYIRARPLITSLSTVRCVTGSESFHLILYSRTPRKISTPHMVGPLNQYISIAWWIVCTIPWSHSGLGHPSLFRRPDRLHFPHSPKCFVNVALTDSFFAFLLFAGKRSPPSKSRLASCV